VYPSHADFSVRTVGLAGLGALGVCFGTVVAIDSPSAREVGKFNWGSTLWHELAHAVTLGMTDHRVPRWFTEGLSVLEERRARPGWGDDVSLEFLVARKGEKLLPLQDLNDGFVNPDHPGRVAISYYQASLVVELIERDYGFGAIQGLLEAYRKGAGTSAAFHEVLGTSLDEFDQRFQTYLGQQFRGPLTAVRVPADTGPGSAPGGAPPSSGGDWGPRPAARSFPDADDFVGQLRKGRALFEDKNVEEAVRYFERAKLLFPQYAEADSPYWFLALIHKEKGEMKEAAEELARLTALNENHYRARLELASLREGLGDLRGAAAPLEEAVFIYPLEPELHSRLAAMESRAGERKKAIRERQAVVALAPVDRPEALYQLAVAYLEAGDAAAARREVLRALELAPGFGKAQELLLRLHGSADGKASSGGHR
jgi:tetratricopeptide (TPR) repeat protein